MKKDPNNLFLVDKKIKHKEKKNKKKENEIKIDNRSLRSNAETEIGLEREEENENDNSLKIEKSEWLLNEFLWTFQFSFSVTSFWIIKIRSIDSAIIDNNKLAIAYKAVYIKQNWKILDFVHKNDFPKKETTEFRFAFKIKIKIRLSFVEFVIKMREKNHFFFLDESSFHGWLDFMYSQHLCEAALIHKAWSLKPTGQSNVFGKWKYHVICKRSTLHPAYSFYNPYLCISTPSG